MINGAWRNSCGVLVIITHPEHSNRKNRIITILIYIEEAAKKPMVTKIPAINVQNKTIAPHRLRRSAFQQAKINGPATNIKKLGFIKTPMIAAKTDIKLQLFFWKKSDLMRQ